jgi:N-sulfoglucosamine sulfohydrolase
MIGGVIVRNSGWLLSAVVLFAPSARAEDIKPQHNVLLLIADDMGLTLGCYGDTVAKTPHLDALARRGVRFSHAFATVSSCSPSRSSIYTGLYTHTSGQIGLAHAEHNFHTRPGVKSLPSLLRPAGYRTGIIGKVHVLPRSVYDFDVQVDRINPRNGVMMAKAARKFIDETRRPFCLVMGYTDPHRAARGFANDVKYPGIPATKYDPKTVPQPYFLPDAVDARADLADYYESASRLDQNVGLVLEELKSSGRGSDTFVIFLSDNGIPFPGAKTTLYDAGVHLPLIVHRPGQKKTGIVNRAMVSWVDILPTILEWASVKPQKLPGRSFLGIFEDESPKGWDTVFGSHTFHEVTMYYPMRTVRTRTHKYIRNLAHRLDFPFAADLYNSPTWQAVLRRGDRHLGKRTIEQYVHRSAEELYDLESDPNELKNVAGDPAHAKTLAELRKTLRDWQEQTKDPWTVKYRYE